jgi:hypothetical protein
MPKEMEARLRKEAKAKGMSGEKMDAYVYGTMNKLKKKGSWKDDLKNEMHRPGSGKKK